jgi:hypothetical protein
LEKYKKVFFFSRFSRRQQLFFFENEFFPYGDEHFKVQSMGFLRPIDATACLNESAYVYPGPDPTTFEFTAGTTPAL